MNNSETLNLIGKLTCQAVKHRLAGQIDQALRIERQRDSYVDDMERRGLGDEAYERMANAGQP